VNRYDFRACREALGLTQIEMGELIGLRSQTVSNIERGSKITPQTEKLTKIMVKAEGLSYRAICANIDKGDENG